MLTQGHFNILLKYHMGPVPAEDILLTTLPYSSMAHISTNFANSLFTGILQAGSPLKNFSLMSLNPFTSSVPLTIEIVSAVAYQERV